MTKSRSTTADAAGDVPVRHPVRWLALLCVLHFLLALGFNIVTPAAVPNQHNPDENAHMLYVKDLASGHVPVFKPGANAYESHQPPLYYALAVPVYAASQHSGMATATRVVRVLSSILGVLLVIMAYLAVIRLMPSEPRVALGAAGFIALLPMNAAISGAVGNDVLINLLLVAGLWKLIRLCCSGEASPERVIRWEGAALLGVIFGFAVLTKTTGLLLAPAIVVAFAFLAWRKAAEPKSAVRAIVVALGIGLLMASPWLARNQMLYGDPLAQRIFTTSFDKTAKADDLIRGFGGFGPYLMADAQWTFASFWGVFDSMSFFWGQDPRGRTPSPLAPLSMPYGILFGLGVAGLVGLFPALRREDTRPDARQQAVLWGLLTLVLATFYTFFLFNMTFFQAQGRYWYPALLPFALAFALGFRGFYPQRAWLNGVYIALALGMLALNVYTLFVLLPARYALG